MLKVEIFYIFIGLFLGFFTVYITTKKPKIIIKCQNSTCSLV